MGISIWQILIVLGLVLIVFGPSRLPGLGKSLGQALRGFKKGISEDEIDVTNSSEKIDEKKNEEPSSKNS